MCEYSPQANLKQHPHLYDLCDLCSNNFPRWNGNREISILTLNVKNRQHLQLRRNWNSDSKQTAISVFRPNSQTLQCIATSQESQYTTSHQMDFFIVHWNKTVKKKQTLGFRLWDYSNAQNIVFLLCHVSGVCEGLSHCPASILEDSLGGSMTRVHCWCFWDTNIRVLCLRLQESHPLSVRPPLSGLCLSRVRTEEDGSSSATSCPPAPAFPASTGSEVEVQQHQYDADHAGSQGGERCVEMLGTAAVRHAAGGGSAYVSDLNSDLKRVTGVVVVPSGCHTTIHTRVLHQGWSDFQGTVGENCKVGVGIIGRWIHHSPGSDPEHLWASRGWRSQPWTWHLKPFTRLYLESLFLKGHTWCYLLATFRP